MFWNDECFVMEVLGHEFKPDQWCLFTDSSKVSLKAVLLCNGNRFPSVPLAHAANMKESYESVKLLLGKIKYGEFKWKLCGDLKVVAVLLGIQLRYTKYCCFLCEWDSQDKNPYVNKLWPKRTSLTPGEKNVINPPLVLPEKIYLLPLHSWTSWKTLWKVWIKPAVDSNMWGISSQMWMIQKSRGYIYRTPDQGTDARQTVRWRPEWDWKKCMVVF